MNYENLCYVIFIKRNNFISLILLNLIIYEKHEISLLSLFTDWF